MDNSSIGSMRDVSPGVMYGWPPESLDGSKGDGNAGLIAEVQQLVAALMNKQMEAGIPQTGTNETPLPQTTLPQASLAQTSLPQTSPPASASNAGSGAYSALDDYSAQNDQSDLGKWSDLAASNQGISLERPIAAMQILSGQNGPNGQPPTPAQMQAAMQFVNDNPSLKTAMQNTGALNSDGTINQKKMQGLLDSANKNLSQADNNVKNYMQKHPDADADSINEARSAALLQAYNPIAGESAGHQSNGKNNGYGGGKNGGGITTKQQISDLQDNEGFSSALKSAAQAFSTSGAFDAIDRAGADKATTKADGKIDDDNLSSFITSDASSSASGSQSFLEDASLQNITANTDISNLSPDIFANPQNYTPRQKAAVMVQLMKTLVNVQAGGSDGLRDVSKTVAALTQDIQTLASDPATQAYLQQTVPPAMQNLGSTFAQAGGLPSPQGGGDSDVSGSSDQSQTSPSGIIDQVHDGLNAGKTVSQSLSNLANGEGFMGLGGDSAAAAEAAGAAGGAEGAAAGADGAAAAGAASGTADGVIGAVAGGLAGAAPVLAIGAGIAGIAGIVMAIVQAVQKKHHQNEFAANVNPTLQQFGIPLPS